MFILHARDNSTNEQQIQRIKSHFSHFEYVKFNSRIYTMVVTENETNIFEVFRKTDNDSLSVDLLSTYEQSLDRFSHEEKKFIWEKRQNLTGVNIKVAIVPSSPFIEKINQVR